MPDVAGRAERSEDLAIASLVPGLIAGDETAWSRLLTEQHQVFQRAVRIGCWRAGFGRPAAATLEAMVDDAKVYFYQAFRRGFRSFDGEARFYAFLHRTVQNFVQEQRRDRARGPVAIDDDETGDLSAGEALARWLDEDRRGVDPELLQRLQKCLLRLPGPYRAVVLLHHFQEQERPLRALAAVLDASVEAVCKRYHRAVAMLRACLGGGEEVLGAT